MGQVTERGKVAWGRVLEAHASERPAAVPLTGGQGAGGVSQATGIGSGGGLPAVELRDPAVGERRLSRRGLVGKAVRLSFLEGPARKIPLRSGGKVVAVVARVGRRCWPPWG